MSTSEVSQRSLRHSSVSSNQTNQVFPSIQQILDQMRNNHSPTDPRCGSTYAFEELLTAIALQMLASCYTTVPASSAHQFPLFQQRKEVQVITALSLHARHRFDPAAGHQARPPSETAALPGLYGGPTLEDELAERLSKRRRVDSRKSDFPHFSIENSWADGPSSAEAQSPPQRTHSRDSSRSSVDAGFFSRLICQPSMPKNPRRKQNTLFLSRLSLKRWRQKDPQTRDSDPQETQMRPLQHLTAQAMQRIPSTLRLRHTQSAPRITAKVSDAVTRPVQARRHSSNPSIGSPLAYPFELPDVRQTSVTPDPDRKLQDAMQGAVRGCGRGDLIAAHEDFAFPDSRQEYYMQRPALHASTQHDMPTETISPLAGPAVSPYVEVATSPATDYFSSVYANRVLPYHARTLSRAWEEQNDAGPDYEDDPRLQKMLGGILKEASESDASEIEKTKRGRRF